MTKDNIEYIRSIEIILIKEKIKKNPRYLHLADWFILSAWDNRDSLTPLHVWAFHKDDIV